MKSSIMSFAALSLLVIALILGYYVIDTNITLSYLQASQTSSERSIDQLEHLLGSTWAGMPHDEVFGKLEAEQKKRPAGEIVLKKDGDIIWFDDIQFNFKDGKLVDIGSQ